MRCANVFLLAFGCTGVYSAQLALRVVPVHPAAIFGLETRQSSSCESGERTCGSSGCIPSSATCCSASEGTFCPSGYRCDGDGCCENGELCSGPGLSCPNGSERCGLDCVLEGECSSGGSGSGSSSSTTTSSTRSSTQSVSSPTGSPTGSSGGNTNSTNAGSGISLPLGYGLLSGFLAAAVAM